MDDRALGVRGQLAVELGGELVDPGDVAAARGVELLAPPAQLSLQVPVGSAELGEPDFIGTRIEFSDMQSTAMLGRSLRYLAERTASSSSRTTR